MNTLAYSDKIKAVVDLLEEADYILIGAGAGLSASAGLNYNDQELFQKWFPILAERGLRTIWEAVTTYWAPDDNNRLAFWAYWANHIQKIRYDAPPGEVYLNLYRLVKGKNHFVITTNVDGQFVKAGFNPNSLYGPQGDYACFQCETPCQDILYDNQGMIQKMLAHMDFEKFLIAESDIPHCPNCGGYLERNLRIDNRFVGKPHMRKRKEYTDFVDKSTTGNLVLLELGCGFNTPGIIRFPFEKMTLQHPNATLIRINKSDPQVLNEVASKTICLEHDITEVMQDVLEGQKSN